MPPHWERHVLAAYFRMLGQTQKQAAQAVGRSLRTITDWESDKELWAQAREEAKARWLTEVVDASRVSLLSAIRAGDGELSLRVLERTDDALAPPAYQHKHSGEMEVTMHVRTARDRVASKLKIIAERQEAQA